MKKDTTIAQAATSVDNGGLISNEYVTARQDGDFVMCGREDVTRMDVSANQMVSVAASLVPFLENDDANRALMGSNMQRQAVPLHQVSRPACWNWYGAHCCSRLWCNDTSAPLGNRH